MATVRAIARLSASTVLAAISVCVISGCASQLRPALSKEVYVDPYCEGDEQDTWKILDFRKIGEEDSSIISISCGSRIVYEEIFDVARERYGPSNELELEWWNTYWSRIDSSIDVWVKGNTELHTAAILNDVDIISNAVALGADLEARNTQGSTPLHLAAQVGAKDAIARLLALGADPTACTGSGLTLFEFALVNWQRDLVLSWLGDEMLPSQKSQYAGLLPIHVACYLKYMDMTKILLEHGADINEVDDFGRTPLQFAVDRGCVPKWGYVGFVQFLLDQGACVNLRANNGFSVLHLTTDSDMIELLLQHGADPNAVDKDFGISPLYMQIDWGAIFYRERGEKFDANPPEWYGDCLRRVELLLDAGADPNCRARDGETPLHRAVRMLNYSVARELLGRGANLRLRDRGGVSPLGMARASGDLYMLSILRGL